MFSRVVVCLMGPTASGKTDIAIRLSTRFPVELVSVDSALVYRGMDIGTAKPDTLTLKKYPHALIDIVDPEVPYSAGKFVRDAEREIDAIHERDRIPLLVGGTMLYFRTLINGMAALPSADETTRASIDHDAAANGWPAMHRRLLEVDPESASRINPNDSQRIQRALEVYMISGRTLTDWHVSAHQVRDDLSFIRVALLPDPRSTLHERIEQRLDCMLDQGLVEEVRHLRERLGLTSAHPSMRAVGYRQCWSFLNGDYDVDEARRCALSATRQLAKRQLTWLRSEPDLFTVNPLETDAFRTISRYMEVALGYRKN